MKKPDKTIRNFQPMPDTGRANGIHACNLLPGRKRSEAKARGERTLSDAGSCCYKDNGKSPVERKPAMEIPALKSCRTVIIPKDIQGHPAAGSTPLTPN